MFNIRVFLIISFSQFLLLGCDSDLKSKDPNFFSVGDSTFSCSTGTLHNAIDCELEVSTPVAASHIEVFRLEGSTAPAKDCRSGYLVHSATQVSPIQQFTDIPENANGKTYSYRACFFDDNGQANGQLTSVGVSAKDLEAPGNLDGFICSTGTAAGQIDCSIDFPEDTSDINSLSVRRLAGEGSPNEDCISDGTEAFTLNSGFSGTVSFTDDTGSSTGETFNYRICLEDRGGLINSSHTSNNVIAFDNTPPSPLTAFSCTPGILNFGDTSCSLTFPGDTSDYYQVILLELSGATAPNSDCKTDGEVISNLAPPFSSGSITVPHSFIAATNSFSYRLCILDSNSNQTSSDTAVNIATKTSFLSGFSCVTGAGLQGDIDCTVDVPADTSSMSSISIRRLSGATAPNINCSSDGEEVASLTSPFVDQVITDATGSTTGGSFSYRACFFTSGGRFVQTTDTSEAITAKP